MLDLGFRSLTLYHAIPTFNNPQRRSLLKTFGEKEKMLVFNPNKDQNHYVKYFYFVICKCFQVDQSKILSSGSGLWKCETLGREALW